MDAILRNCRMQLVTIRFRDFLFFNLVLDFHDLIPLRMAWTIQIHFSAIILYTSKDGERERIFLEERGGLMAPIGTRLVRLT